MSKNFCNNIFGFGEVKSDHANVVFQIMSSFVLICGTR